MIVPRPLNNFVAGSSIYIHTIFGIEIYTKPVRYDVLKPSQAPVMTDPNYKIGIQAVTLFESIKYLFEINKLRCGIINLE